jgi:hypothetical protein
MTKCKECDIVDLGVNRINIFGEVHELCPNCGNEDSVEEIDELEWADNMESADADFTNELQNDYE